MTLSALLTILGCLDTATAQDNTVSVAPSSLTFCVPANNSPAPPAQTLTVTSTSGTPVGYNANAFPNWIRMDGTTTPPSISGTTSASPIITVQIDSSAYSGGGASQSGTIQVNGANSNPITVPVIVNVTSTCANGNALSATPGAVSLSSNVASQNVTIGGPSATQITAALSFGSGNPSGWFGLSSTSVTAGQTVNVSLLSSTGLPSGAQGQIVFTQNGTSNSITVPVTFSTGNNGNGVFISTPGALNVSFVTPQDAAKSQLITITGPITPLSVSVNLGSGPAGWISVPVPPQGSTPTSFQTVITPSALSTGVVYSGSITVTQANNAANYTIIPVTASVGTGSFSATPSPLTFTIQGQGVIQQNQIVTITGPNNAPLVATAQVNNGGYQWLTFGGNPAAYASLTNSTVQFVVTVNPANLSANQVFTGNIVLTQNGSTVLNIPVIVTTLPPVRPRDFNRSGLSGALLYESSTGTAYTALSNGNGTYQYVYNLITSAFDTLRTGDFNGDSKADVVVYNSHNAAAYIGLGNGDGTFTFQSLFWSPGYDFVEAGDLNGDGKTDFVLYNSSTGTMYTGISNGSGGFTYRYTLISAGYTFLRLGDFAGNGKAGLFLYRISDGLASLGVGDGAGGFAFHPLSMSFGYDHIDTGDLNRDGRTDIIAYNSATGSTVTGISDGVGGFGFTNLQFTPGFTSVRLADHLGDGYADVTLYNKNTALGYFGRGTGFGTFIFQSLFWSPGYDYVEPEDVNGDGKTDIILYNTVTGTEYTGLSNADGTFTYTYQLWGSGKMPAR